MTIPKVAALNLILLVLLVFSGCNPLPASQNATPTRPILPVTTAIPTPESTQTPVSNPVTPTLMDHIILWIPPDFDPANHQAGVLLQEHLEIFMLSNPEVKIDVRVKETNGATGILSALETTLNSAPKAAPSLILMQQDDLETAAMRKLIQSPPQLQTWMEEDDWYDYARELAQYQNTYYGIPLAADAMILAIRSTDEPSVDKSWENVLSSSQTLLFPAGDPRALFTINLYMSAGGTFFDEQNNLKLDTASLEKVLEFYATAVQTEIIPPNVIDYSDDEQVWAAFGKKLADQAVCWISDYLSHESTNVIGMELPPLGNEPVTMVSGWMWTLTDPFAERIEMDLKLMQYLTSAEFEAAWTVSAGYLPVRPSGLSGWDDPVQRALISQTTISAASQPSREILGLIGPVFNEAVYNVIAHQMQPSEAARIASGKINTK